MLIEQLLTITNANRPFDVIKTNCTQYLRESAGLPLLKALPTSYSNVQKVKIRLQKRKDHIAEVFDKAFGNTFTNIRQRAVFAYPSTPSLTEGLEPFYVFPIDGYRYMYSKEVTNSSSDYQRVIDTLVESLDSSDTATEIVSDLLKHTYCTKNLLEGISSESEIIFYGIPYYYAVRANVNYESLLT